MTLIAPRPRGALQRLLGAAPAPLAAAMQQAMARVAGPPLDSVPLGGIVAFLQPEPPDRLLGGQKARLRLLAGWQQRLEAACQIGPFLPADPAAALLPATAWTSVLAESAAGLAAALARDGALQEWQLTLGWPPAQLLAPHRDALRPWQGTTPAALAAEIGRLVAAEMAPRVAAVEAALAGTTRQWRRQPAAAPHEAGFLLLIGRDGMAALEAALQGLPADLAEAASADLRGPMPPVHFAAWRVAECRPDALRQAWSLLGLGEGADAASLRRSWRRRAAALHPDAGQAADGAAMAGAREAYRLLAPLLRGTTDLPGLLRQAGPRLVPAETPEGAWDDR
ncbi:GvpL/GvpF family gas vesicle protein [Pseudoroseomonas cervicalis]|uniref:GvpL/GvpF family gas vesicle protein n=1 Tax=Teichococcus cervicalis TaxID=204525 RepID=UPI0022F19AB2|nr:GvpL/GvpF family gas vesicle protein [Pseudoroseomonas cervicalis]WBV43497.1 GvpL/GvpF family gas vesicle protein [Pseudoroseomonas cervicalis]